MTLLLEAPPRRPAPPPAARAKGDPRIPFAVILSVYAVLGATWLGFNRSPGQILLTVLVGCALDMGLHALLRRRELIVPLSAYISSLSLALLLNYAHDPFLLFLPVFLTVASKYLVTYRGSHVFNPSLFGVAVTLLATGGLITTAPAYQWGGSWAMSIFIATAALSLFVFRVGRGWLIVSFLLFYALQTALRAWFMRAHLPPEMLFLGTLSTPPFFLFVFYMMTDPKTSPTSRRGQVYTALAVTLIDLYLHTQGSVFTFFYAAFAVQAAKFFAWHAGDAWREGLVAHLRARLGSARTLRTAAVLSLIAVTGGAAYRFVLRPHVALTDAGFRLEAVAPETSGLRWAMDPGAYESVDPRLHHVSKWLLSVGSSVEAADVDGDGRPDLFVTSPLAVAGSKTGMYLNRGAMKFERLALPLDSLEHAHTRHGIASGGVLFDHDGDGDQDLLVLVSFGTPRLLRNTLRETGRPGFEDVSREAGLTQYTISVSANVLDFDRDGHPDILIGNVLAPYLPDYADSTRLNIFRLPRPAYEGDRRMFRFMHDGWHNATNGGRNVLLRNRGDGTFQELDAARMGMPETHWTISVGTGDFDADGWTDLYLASDFGRDDLYLNERGRFRRVAGRMFGDVGMDTYKGMNSTVADFDRDGRLDVYVSNVHQALQAEGSLLWMNRGTDSDGTPRMRDEASARGALNPHRFGWGAGAGDLDNDGWPDLVQANGMVGDRLDARYPGCPDYWYVNHKLMQAGPEIHTYADMWGDLRGRCIYPDEKVRVYLNRGAAAPQFVDVAELAGVRGGDNTRGVAMADLDDDGRVDLAISSQHGLPHLLRNVPSPRAAAHEWIGVRLVGGGPGCTRDALGSTVTIRLPGQPPRVREVQAANGFASQADARVHFGLGEWRGGVPVEVRWCGRETARYRLAPGRYHTLAR